MTGRQNRRGGVWTISILLTGLLAGCGGTPSGDFNLGGGIGTTTGTTTLPRFVLTATAHTTDILLVWSAPTNTTTSLLTYDVSRTGGVGGTSTPLTSGYGSVRYTDSTAQTGTTYTDRITAHAGGLSSDSNADSATPSGPTLVGVGDPATGTPSVGSLFTVASVLYVEQAGGSRLTMDMTLNHTANVSDMLTLQIAGNVYTLTSGVTASSNHVVIDSQAAGVTVPSLTTGQLLSVTATVANTSSPVVANAGRLELTGRVPAARQSETDGPSGFQITLQNAL